MSTIVEGYMPNPPEQSETIAGELEYEAVLASMAKLFALDRLEMYPETVTRPLDVVRDPAFAAACAATETPLVEQGTLPADDVRKFDKLELARPTGSFKEQGAFRAAWRVVQEHPEVRMLAAPSAGNHALGVQYFADWLNRRRINTGEIRLNIDGTVLEEDQDKLVIVHTFCKEDASELKKRNLRAGGAVVHDDSATLADAVKSAQQFVAAANQAADPPDSNEAKPVVAALVHPYRDPDVMAGQANIVLSSMVQLWQRGIDTRLQPTVWYAAGGGIGLGDGAAVATDVLVRLGLLHPDSHVVISQMEDCDAARRGLDRLDRGEIDMEGLFIDENGLSTFESSADGTAVEVPELTNLQLARYLRNRGRLRFATVAKAAVGLQKQRSSARGVPEEPSSAIAGAVMEAEYLHAKYYGALPTCAGHFTGMMIRIASGRNESDALQEDFNSFADAGRQALSTVVVRGPTLRAVDTLQAQRHPRLPVPVPHRAGGPPAKWFDRTS